MVRALALPSALLLVAFLAACGSSDSTSPDDESDGRYYAPTNGTRLSEDVACETFRKAFADQGIKQQCAITASLCPAFIRRQGGSGDACRQYDEGAVQACGAYVRDQTECAEIADAPNHCVIKTYECP